jgi:uncharacterized protein involved in tolerance to divalent cations
MKKQTAIKLAGSVRQLADLLGITHQAVYAWPDDVPKPKEYELMVKRPTWFVRAGGKK